MSKRIVKHALDPADLPPLTDAEKEQLAALAAMPDDTIDFSDSPPLAESFWTKARRNPFGLSKAASTNVRIDPDVSAWLKTKGDDIEECINGILRREMARTNER